MNYLLIKIFMEKQWMSVNIRILDPQCCGDIYVCNDINRIWLFQENENENGSDTIMKNKN